MIHVLVDSLVVSDESGFACSKSKLVESGILHLRPFNISDDGRLNLSEVYQVPENEAPRGKTRLEAGDILFNNTNSAELVGKAALVPSAMDAGFSNHLTRIRLNAKLIEPAYFAFWLRRLREQGFFTAQATQWVSQAAYKTSELRKVEIALPELPEQRRIVDLLSRAEGIVCLRREAEKKAAELIPALFLDTFGDPVANPKGWPVANLESVAQIFSGATKGRRFDPSEAVELPYMRVANVKDDYLDLSEVKTIAVKKNEVEKYRLMAGDLLMTEGGDPDKLGRAALWAGEIETCLHQNHIFKVRADRSKVLPEYLRELAGSHYGKSYFLSVAKKTTGIASINRTQLSRFPVLVPPLNLQTIFFEKFAAARSIQSQQASATAKAEAAFDAVLATAFN